MSFGHGCCWCKVASGMTILHASRPEHLESIWVRTSAAQPMKTSVEAQRPCLIRPYLADCMTTTEPGSQVALNVSHLQYSSIPDDDVSVRTKTPTPLQQSYCDRLETRARCGKERRKYLPPTITQRFCSKRLLLRHPVPLLRNKHGNASKLDMCRGMTLSCCLSELSQSVLSSVFEQCLTTWCKSSVCDLYRTAFRITASAVMH